MTSRFIDLYCTVFIMKCCVHRCGSSGLQRTFCTGAVRLQETAASSTDSTKDTKDSRNFRSDTATHAPLHVFLLTDGSWIVSSIFPLTHVPAHLIDVCAVLISLMRCWSYLSSLSLFPPLLGEDSPLRWGGKKFEELPIAHIKATYNK